MSNESSVTGAREYLVAYAVEWLAEWCERDATDAELTTRGAAGWLKPYLALLDAGRPPPKPGTPLLSIFSRVRREGDGEPDAAYWPAVALSVEQPVYPTREPPAVDGSGLWDGFLKDWRRLKGFDGGLHFEAFTHVLHKWAWAVPCRTGEPGVSLYDEFRALSALVHGSGCADRPADRFLLVGGDIPGIQDFVYTITSKGAAKGLRGRSFFIQLLGDAVVRRILADLELPETNVIYAAGGNFMLLAPARAEGIVAAIALEMNRALLAAFDGELALCLACAALPAGDVGTGEFAAHSSRAVRDEIARQKRRRFVDLAEARWADVFGPKGQGKRDFCSVCQHEQGEKERGEALEGGGWKCEQCHSFEELAQQIARDPLLMFASRTAPAMPPKGWQRLLWQVTGQWYVFGPDLATDAPADSRIYAVNDPAFLDGYAHGFRLLANTTPHGRGQVRTFEELADDATGLKRVGVLRMDVDNLGQVLTRWLPDRTLASTSALSLALDRFFSGGLDAMCRETLADPGMAGVEPGRAELLYVIYAGGDDLFVVGAWDLMPPLADRIRQRFAAYVGGNPALRISAGITLEDRKFPLYQAAERAGEALDGAKDLEKRRVEGCEVEKDAVCVLGQAVGWEAYPLVRDLAGELVTLVEKGGVPRSLRGTLRAIHARYLADTQAAEKRGLKEPAIHYGPWMWRKVYYLSRLRAACRQKASADAIERLERDVLKYQNMPYVGLAARWAEYLTRGG